MTAPTLTGSALRKAAIVLMALDQDVASLVMGRLDSDTMAAVTRELAQLGHVPAPMQSQVLREFYQEVTVQPADDRLTDGGGSQRTSQTRVTAGGDVGLDVLGQADPSALWAAIGQEHPQTIALVVNALAGPQAEALLAQMPSQLQDDVVHRVATMRPPQPDVLAEVAQVVRARLDHHAFATGTAKQSPPLAGRASSLPFEALPQVPDSRLRLALEQVTLEDLALALRTADQPIVRKVMRNLGRSAAGALKRQMAQQPPVRLSAIEAAAQRIMQAVDRAAQSQQ